MFNYSYFFHAIDFLGTAAKAVLLGYGARRILGADLTLGEFIQFFFLLDFFFEPIRDVSEKYNLLQSAMAP